MNTIALRTLTAGALTAGALFAAAAAASADPVTVPTPPTPPWSRSADGLTYCFEGHCLNWDKTGHYVCQTGGPTGPVCDVIMLGVRALPPTNIGDLVPHNIIP
jgi:hypothetical protein